MIGPVTALVAGILIGRAGDLSTADAVFATVAFSGLAALSYRAARQWLHKLCVFLLIVSIGAGTVVVHSRGERPVIDASPDETVVVRGCVVEPSVTARGWQEFVAELAPGARARVRVYYEESTPPPKLAYGRRVDITGKIRRPRGFWNPGAFDYRRYLERLGIYWTISVRSPADLELLPGDCGSRWWALVHRLRARAIRRLDQVFHSYPDAARLLRAALFGDTSSLEERWLDRFRETGAYHTLVVSGLHLAILAGLVHVLLRVLVVPRGWKVVTTIALAWVYALLTGGRLPVLRAASGLTLFLIGSWCFRRARLLNILATIAFVFLVVDPGQLFDTGFHLSFLAVGVIGAWAIPLIERTTAPLAAALRDLADDGRDPGLPPNVQRWRVELRLFAETVSLWTHWPRRFLIPVLAGTLRASVRLWELVLVSGVVQAALALPLVIHFQRFSWTGVAANPAVVLGMSVALQAGLVAVVTGIPTAAWVAAGAADLCFGLVKELARWGASWRVPPPPCWLALGFLAALVAGALWLRMAPKRRWLAFLVPGVLLGLILTHPFPPKIHSGTLELTVIDVGQAESLFLAFPDGRTAIVDGGLRLSEDGRPVFDAGERVIAPYLWRRSIRRLDVLVSTHGHLDHIGGLSTLVHLFRPKQLWLGAAAADPATTSLVAEARRLGVEVVRLAAGERFSYGGAELRVLAPDPGQGGGPAAHNDDSLVLHVRYGSRAFLLTGDIEAVERRIAASGLPRAAVLKVPHHGSKTSTSAELLRAIRPAFAAISAGYGNPYRFPSTAVLERLAAARVLTFCTSRNGLISFGTDGWRVWAKPLRWTVPNPAPAGRVARSR